MAVLLNSNLISAKSYKSTPEPILLQAVFMAATSWMMSRFMVVIKPFVAKLHRPASFSARLNKQEGSVINMFLMVLHFYIYYRRKFK